ncbi:MAG TPA: hypothetical protein VM144_04555 [Aestuariivirga sp.]|nr:hypothetical protein [Aestuariivirga sp.]
MNIRILAASALALAILVPAANAASSHRGNERDHREMSSNGDACAIGSTLNLLTDQCVPLRAKVVHARVVKYVVKPANTAFARMTAIQNSHNEM